MDTKRFTELFQAILRPSKSNKFFEKINVWKYLSAEFKFLVSNH